MDEMKILQAMFFRHPGGRILEKHLRELGHFDTGIENDQQRIEHNFAKRLLMLCGANIQIGREHIPTPAPATGTEQDNILGVQGGQPNA